MANGLTGPARRSTLWGFVALGLVAGCLDTSTPSVTSGGRIVNAISDASRQPIHLRLDGYSVGQSIPFLGTSQVAGGGIYLGCLRACAP